MSERGLSPFMKAAPIRWMRIAADGDRDADGSADRLYELVEQAVGAGRAGKSDVILLGCRPIGGDQIDEPPHLVGGGNQSGITAKNAVEKCCVLGAQQDNGGLNTLSIRAAGLRSFGQVWNLAAEVQTSRGDSSQRRSANAMAHMLTQTLTPTVGTMAVDLPRRGTYIFNPGKHCLLTSFGGRSSVFEPGWTGSLPLLTAHLWPAAGSRGDLGVLVYGGH